MNNQRKISVINEKTIQEFEHYFVKEYPADLIKQLNDKQAYLDAIFIDDTLQIERINPDQSSTVIKSAEVKQLLYDQNSGQTNTNEIWQACMQITSHYDKNNKLIIDLPNDVTFQLNGNNYRININPSKLRRLDFEGLRDGIGLTNRAVYEDMSIFERAGLNASVLETVARFVIATGIDEFYQDMPAHDQVAKMELYGKIKNMKNNVIKNSWEVFEPYYQSLDSTMNSLRDALNNSDPGHKFIHKILATPKLREKLLADSTLNEEFNKLRAQSIELTIQQLTAQDIESFKNLSTMSLIDNQLNGENNPDLNVGKIIKNGAELTKYIAADFLACESNSEAISKYEYWMAIAYNTIFTAPIPNYNVAQIIQAEVVSRAKNKWIQDIAPATQEQGKILEEIFSLKGGMDKLRDEHITQLNNHRQFIFSPIIALKRVAIAGEKYANPKGLYFINAVNEEHLDLSSAAGKEKLLTNSPNLVGQPGSDNYEPSLIGKMLKEDNFVLIKYKDDEIYALQSSNFEANQPLTTDNIIINKLNSEQLKLISEFPMGNSLIEFEELKKDTKNNFPRLLKGLKFDASINTSGYRTNDMVTLAHEIESPIEAKPPNFLKRPPLSSLTKMFLDLIDEIESDKAKAVNKGKTYTPVFDNIIHALKEFMNEYNTLTTLKQTPFSQVTKAMGKVFYTIDQAQHDYKVHKQEEKSSKLAQIRATRHWGALPKTAMAHNLEEYRDQFKEIIATIDYKYDRVKEERNAFIQQEQQALTGIITEFKNNLDSNNPGHSCIHKILGNEKTRRELFKNSELLNEFYKLYAKSIDMTVEQLSVNAINLYGNIKDSNFIKNKMTDMTHSDHTIQKLAEYSLALENYVKEDFTNCASLSEASSKYEYWFRIVHHAMFVAPIIDYNTAYAIYKVLVEVCDKLENLPISETIAEYWDELAAKLQAPAPKQLEMYKQKLAAGTPFIPAISIYLDSIDKIKENEPSFKKVYCTNLKKQDKVIDPHDETAKETLLNNYPHIQDVLYKRDGLALMRLHDGNEYNIYACSLLSYKDNIIKTQDGTETNLKFDPENIRIIKIDNTKLAEIFPPTDEWLDFDTIQKQKSELHTELQQAIKFTSQVNDMNNFTKVDDGLIQMTKAPINLQHKGDFLAGISGYSRYESSELGIKTRDRITELLKGTIYEPKPGNVKKRKKRSISLENNDSTKSISAPIRYDVLSEKRVNAINTGINFSTIAYSIDTLMLRVRAMQKSATAGGKKYAEKFQSILKTIQEQRGILESSLPTVSVHKKEEAAGKIYRAIINVHAEYKNSKNNEKKHGIFAKMGAKRHALFKNKTNLEFEETLNILYRVAEQSACEKKHIKNYLEVEVIQSGLETKANVDQQDSLHSVAEEVNSNLEEIKSQVDNFKQELNTTGKVGIIDNEVQDIINNLENSIPNTLDPLSQDDLTDFQKSIDAFQQTIDQELAELPAQDDDLNIDINAFKETMEQLNQELDAILDSVDDQKIDHPIQSEPSDAIFAEQLEYNRQVAQLQKLNNIISKLTREIIDKKIDVGITPEDVQNYQPKIQAVRDEMAKLNLSEELKVSVMNRAQTAENALTGAPNKAPEVMVDAKNTDKTALPGPMPPKPTLVTPEIKSQAPANNAQPLGVAGKTVRVVLLAASTFTKLGKFVKKLIKPAGHSHGSTTNMARRSGIAPTVVGEDEEKKYMDLYKEIQNVVVDTKRKLRDENINVDDLQVEFQKLVEAKLNDSKCPEAWKELKNPITENGKDAGKDEYINLIKMLIQSTHTAFEDKKNVPINVVERNVVNLDIHNNFKH